MEVRRISNGMLRYVCMWYERRYLFIEFRYWKIFKVDVLATISKRSPLSYKYLSLMSPTCHFVRRPVSLVTCWKSGDLRHRRNDKSVVLWLKIPYLVNSIPSPNRGWRLFFPLSLLFLLVTIIFCLQCLFSEFLNRYVRYLLFIQESCFFLSQKLHMHRDQWYPARLISIGMRHKDAISGRHVPKMANSISALVVLCALSGLVNGFEIAWSSISSPAAKLAPRGLFLSPETFSFF